jgi:hypothetical protein
MKKDMNGPLVLAVMRITRKRERHHAETLAPNFVREPLTSVTRLCDFRHRSHATGLQI